MNGTFPPTDPRDLGIDVGDWLGIRPPIRHFDTRAPRRRRSSNRRALILSGGGAKGCFQAGAVKRLWENGYRPDIICGVSVGALNGAKLAEGRDDGPTDNSATDLVRIWQDIASGTIKLVKKDAGFDGIMKITAQELERDIRAAFSPPTIPDLRTIVPRVLKRRLKHLHAIHSWGHYNFPGLFGLINDQLNPEAIARSGIQFLIGLVELETGSLWHVSPDLNRFENPEWGILEREPDLRQTPLALPETRIMGLASAIFASSSMPIYMPPIQAWLRAGDPRAGITRVITALPAEYLEILPRDPASSVYSFLGPWFPSLEPPVDSPPSMHFMDGGLADIIPIRAAMRLGAREIVVISADPLFESSWEFKDFSNIPDDIPIVQYLKAMIGGWSTDVARNDLFLAIAYNEFLGWMYRAFSYMDEINRERFRNQFNEYWRTHGASMGNLLGGRTWLGGFSSFNPDAVSHEISPYGAPFNDEACNITLISPNPGEWEPIEVLKFDASAEILAGITHGEEQADRAIELSFPVPATVISP